MTTERAGLTDAEIDEARENPMMIHLCAAPDIVATIAARDAEIATLRAARVADRNAYVLVADALAAKSDSPEQLAEIARELHKEIATLRARVEQAERERDDVRRMHSQLAGVCIQHQRDRDAAREACKKLNARVATLESEKAAVGALIATRVKADADTFRRMGEKNAADAIESVAECIVEENGAGVKAAAEVIKAARDHAEALERFGPGSDPEKGTRIRLFDAVARLDGKEHP